MGVKQIFRPLFLNTVIFSIIIVARLINEGSGGGIWNYLQLYFIVVGVFFTLLNWKRFSSNRVISSLLVFSLYLLLIGFFSTDSSSIQELFYYIVIPYAAFICVSFYYFASKQNLSDCSVLIIILFLVIAFLFYTKGQIYYISDDERFMGINSYYLIALIPLVLLYLKGIYGYLPFLVAILAVFFADKRTGLICLSLMLFVFMLYSAKSVKQLVLSTIVFLLGIKIINSAYDSFSELYGLDLIQRMNELSFDGGSGRDIIWNRIIHSFQDSSLIDMIFGHGRNSVNQLIGHAAHNDFLQLLYDYGIIALILYVRFYVVCIIEAIKMYRNKYVYCMQFVLSVVLSIVLSCFSFYIIEPRCVGCSAVFWGILLYDWDRFQYEQNIK